MRAHEGSVVMTRWMLVLLSITLAGAAGGEELPRLAGGSWQVTGRVRATVCLGGRCSTSSQRVSEPLYIPDDAASVSVSVIALCPGVTVDDLQGLTTWEPGRKSWFVMRVLERGTFVELLRECSGYPSLRLKGAAAKFRVLSGGEAFDLRATLRFTLVAQGRTVAAVGIVRLHGSRGGDEGLAETTTGPEAMAQALAAALSR